MEEKIQVRVYKNIGNSFISFSLINKAMIKPGETIGLTENEYAQLPEHVKKLIAVEGSPAAAKPATPSQPPAVAVSSFPQKGSYDEFTTVIAPPAARPDPSVDFANVPSVNPPFTPPPAPPAPKPTEVGDRVANDGIVSLDTGDQIESIENEDKDLYAGTGHQPQPEENLDAIDADKIIAQHSAVRPGANAPVPAIPAPGTTFVKNNDGVAKVSIVEAAEQVMQKDVQELSESLNEAFKKSLTETEINQIKEDIMQSQDKGYLNLLISKNPDERVKSLAQQRLSELG